MVRRLSTIAGVAVLNDAYFNEVTVLLPGDARETVRQLADSYVLGGVSLGRLYPGAPELHRGLLVTATETTTDDDIEALVTALTTVLTGTREGVSA